ncbi:MAG: hypothetical protein IKR13_00650, partial [Victivallales bacterium]|nr:hypothetical protein [Victivallales bacterium]
MPSVYASIFAALPVISVFGKDWQETTGGPSAELSMRDVQVVFDDGVCRVTSQDTPIRFVRLRWNCTPAEAPLAETLFLGDAWERSYGDLQWRCHDASRTMPWYFLAHDSRGTFGAGVEVQPGAFAHWTADRTGVTLWLDLRCGTRGVAFGGRTMQACRVVHGEWESGVPPFTATKALCRLMCAKPLLAPHPVYGANNWYYAYGKSSHQEMLADAEVLVELCGEVENPPYAVIDDGWQRDRTADG